MSTRGVPSAREVFEDVLAAEARRREHQRYREEGLRLTLDVLLGIVGEEMRRRQGVGRRPEKGAA